MKRMAIFMGIVLLSTNIYSQVEVISTDSIRVQGLELENTGNSSINDSLSTNPTDTVGRKRVFWIHGLAGGESSWQRVFHATRYQGTDSIENYPVRLVEGFNIPYAPLEGSDLINGAKDYADYLRIAAINSPYSAIDSNRAFAIGHSQGGLMARAVRYCNQPNGNTNLYSEPQFKALATFGTPHKGAPIVNSTNGNEVQNWINEGCKALSHAEIQTFLNSIWWLDAVISNRVVSNFTNQLCNGLNKTALPILVDAIRKPMSDSYGIGAQQLNTLASFSANDPIEVVTFYGVEQEPVLWRVVNTMTYTPDSAVTNAYLLTNPFGLNDDQALCDFVNHKMASYHFNWARHTRHTNRPWYILTFSGKKEQAKAHAYQKAYDWLATSNLMWKRFIGARRDTQFIDGYQCDCLFDLGGTNGYSFSSQIVQSPSDCNSANAINCIITPRIRHEIIEVQSDGVVPVPSQRGYPGNLKHQVLLENTNHMQMRNSEQTKIMLNKLFNGKYGQAFKLDEL